jgi:hypothetical protein
MVSLDVPVAEQAMSAPVIAVVSTTSPAHVSMESRLDELLGTATGQQWRVSEVEAEIDFAAEARPSVTVGTPDREPTVTVAVPAVLMGSDPTHGVLAEAVSEHAGMEKAAQELPVAVTAAPSGAERGAAPTAPTTAAPSHVRCRTPVPMPARYPSVIPRATASDGKALPRAYVAKRQTLIRRSPGGRRGTTRS